MRRSSSSVNLNPSAADTSGTGRPDVVLWMDGNNRGDVYRIPNQGGGNFGEWQEIIRTVADTRETYVDRSFGGLPHLPRKKNRWNWNILVFPLKLHDNRNGAVLAARVIEKK